MNLPADIEALIVALRSEVAWLRAENEVLRTENAQLRRRLDQDSSTSSKPPSSDGLGKKPRIAGSLRGRSGKLSGGQAGHKGDTLRQAAAADVVVEHAAWACRHCSAPLTAVMRAAEERRQVFDLPERLIEVVEHRAGIYACAHCGLQTRASFPDDVKAPAQYGPRFRAAAVYLNLGQLIPEDRVAEAMADLFGAARLCPMSLTQWVAAKARALAPVTADIAALAAAAPVRCLDETGFRVAGRNHWLHTIATEALTHYRVSPKRSDLPRNLCGGVVVHDGLKGYCDIEGAAHALCNAHHLRELKALIEIDGEAWAEAMRDLLLEAHRAVGQAKQRGLTALAAETLQAFDARYWETLRAGFAYHRSLPRLPRHPSNHGRDKHRPGQNLLIRLHRFKDDVLRFLVDFTVPFTNNLAEQALRMMKVKMKISGAFRAFAAACDFAALRSVLATARKRGWNILTTLTQNPQDLSQALAV
jgi:transposase